MPAALWLEGPGSCSQAVISLELLPPEQWGVVFVLSPMQNELPVLNSPWWTGFIISYSSISSLLSFPLSMHHLLRRNSRPLPFHSHYTCSA